MIEIKILGSGCSKCKVAENQVRRVVESLNRSDISVVKVENIEEIMKYDIMSTPAIVVNNVVKCSGRVPSANQIIQFINDAILPKDINLNVNESCCCEDNKTVKPLFDDVIQSCGCNHSLKKVVIDFLYLDLSKCSRCQATESTLESSLEEIKIVLLSANFQVELNKIHIASLDDAIRYHFESSPTVRVNGKDVISKILESNCQDCSDFCGSSVYCRDWEFEGVRYTEPPKAMLINAIFKAVYVPESLGDKPEKYVVPQNIIKFFDLQESKNK